MPYLRHLRGMDAPLSMQLYTRGDAQFVCAQLQAADPAHRYDIGCRFAGYEGADYGVTKYGPDDLQRMCRFIEWISDDVMKEMCKDRPLVLQKDSMDHDGPTQAAYARKMMVEHARLPSQAFAWTAQHFNSTAKFVGDEFAKLEGIKRPPVPEGMFDPAFYDDTLKEDK